MSQASTALSRDERSGIAVSDRDCDTIDEFAVKNRISRTQVYREIRAGRLIASKVATKTLITREHGSAWRQSLRHELDRSRIPQQSKAG